MTLNSAGVVQPSFGCQVGIMRRLWGTEITKADAFVVDRNDGAPFVRSLFPLVDAKKSVRLSFVRLALILRIHLHGHIAQILESVVTCVAVGVVYRPLWVIASHVKPSKSVGIVDNAINRDVEVAALFWAAGNLSDFDSAAGLHEPRKNTRLWVVVKKLAQTLRGKIGLSHDAPVKRIGQRPVSVSSTCGLRYFSVGG
jgi:hypothetical protein